MDLLNTISNTRLWNKHGVLAVWAVASLCLLLALANVGWGIYSNSKIRQANYQPQEITPIAHSSGPSYKISDIVSANLFGDPRPKVVVKKAPKTTLNLTLQGILWATDANMARAIIMSGKRKPELYSVGESIKGAKASVKEIRDGEVLLDRNGATESLPLLKKNSSGNREIISFSDPVQERLISSNPAAKRAIKRNQDVNTRKITAGVKPNKTRQPRFKGVDKALKKMGDL